MNKYAEKALQLLLTKAAVVPLVFVAILIAIWWKSCQWEPECMVQWTDTVMEAIVE